ncbi:Gypsy retrotransposon integrase-like protein 1, partial [Trichinella murrelli]
LESLAELDFEVEHRAGRLHGNADALSRTCCTQCGRLSFKDQLLAAQQANPEIQLLRQWLLDASWPVECPPECSRDMHVLWQQRRGWVDYDGLIWRHRRGLTAEEGAKQALRRSLARVRSRFYWPGMSGDVHTWCRTCTQCARRKGPTKNNRAPMQAMFAGYPLQRVDMDILGALEKTPSGNRYVLFLTDYFTKWRAAFPSPTWEPVPWPRCWSRSTSRTLAPLTICTATKAAHLKRRWCWRCADCSALGRRDLLHTTRKRMDRRRGLTARSWTWCPSWSMGTQASGMICHAGVQQQRSREYGSDACDRHAWSRVAVAAGCSDREPAYFTEFYF